MKRKNKNQVTPMKEVARFGNFIVKKHGDGLHSYLRICTADGGWRTDFRDDTLKYGWLMACLGSNSENVWKAVESWIIQLYHMAHVWPDAEFLNDILNAFNALGERTRQRESKKAEEESD